MDAWEIRLCGPLAVRAGGRALERGLPGRQGRLLLAYLVWHRERACPRGELVDLLWPEDPPVAADSALSALLSKLRRALGAGVLSGRSELRFAPPGRVSVDVEEAARAVALAEAAQGSGRFADAVAQAQRALDADLAAFLPDGTGLWATERQHECETLRVRALEAVAAAGVRLGGAALGEAERAAAAAVASAPFRESAHRALMEVHEAAGNPAEALRAFERLRVLLRDELGTAPGPASMAIHARLLRGESAPRPAGAPQAGAVTWPAGLAAAAGRHPLVGREPELGALEDALRRAWGGGGRMVLLAGAAGMGKTRLAAELARQAHEQGAVVLHGRFDEHTPAPFAPIAEMVRTWSAGAPVEPLRERLGARAAELGALLPELGAPLPELGQAPPGAAGTDLAGRRLRFFDAVAALLGEIAGPAPAVVVLDDLQWADRPTLELLRHLVRAPLPRRTLFLATSRDGGAALQELLGDLRREGAVARIDLGGLSREEVAALVRALGVAAPDPAFVAALHAEAGGSPFVVEEVVGHLRAEGERAGTGVTLAEAGVPEGVREVTTRRLRRLGEPARRAVVAGAVIGRDFDFDVLRRATGWEDADALVEALEEAVEAGVIREDARVGRYAFVHSLAQATLYDGLSRTRRARLHGRVGEAIAALPGAGGEDQLPALAHHFAMAAPLGHTERAVDFAIAAARRADRLLAWEEAAEHYREALRVRELAGAGEDRARGELLLALGDSGERAGDDGGARDAFRAAAETARRLGDAALLARAALGYAGPWAMLGRVEPRRVALLAEALDVLGAVETPLRARLLARLALELYYSGDAERRLALTAEAVELARRLGDPATLAACLIARHYALWRPESVGERLAIAGELRRVAERTGDPELELEGAGWTVVDLLEIGDVPGADIQIAAASQLADALQRPLYRWWTSSFRCARAQLAGEFALAERLASETLEAGAAGRPRTPCTPTRRRSSTSAASRGGWPSSRTPFGASPSSIPRFRRGGRRSRCCWSRTGVARRRSRRWPDWRRTASRRCHGTPTG